jgi:LEA14-like dessication related protein
MKYIVVLFAALSLICSCMSMGAIGSKPEARIEKFSVDSISFRDVTLLFDIAMNNPYPVGIDLERITFAFNIEGKKLFETTTPKGFKIRANGTETTKFTVNIEYNKIEKIVKDYMKKEYLACDVAGKLVLKIPATGIPGVPPSVEFPFNLKTNIPAIKPEISIKNFKVNAPSVAAITSAIKDIPKKNITPEKITGLFGKLLAGKDIKEEIKIIKPEELDIKLDVNFDIEVQNKTAAKILFNDLSYDFMMNGENMFKGNTKDSKMVGNTLILKISNQLSSKAMGQGIIKIFKDKKGSFVIKGQTLIKLPESIRTEPLKLQFDEKGNFSL